MKLKRDDWKQLGLAAAIVIVFCLGVLMSRGAL